MLSARITRRALRHHGPLAVAGIALVVFFYSIVASPDWRFRFSLATAYSGMILLAVTLILGPWSILRGKHVPVSTDLRRDLGWWSAAISLIHVVFGIQIHMGNPWLYFFYGSRAQVEWRPRFDIFGWANHLGLLATLILLLLAVLSNDASILRLGSRRWKNAQRTSYLLFILTAVHGAIYQRLENRKGSWVAFFAALILVCLAFQISGLVRFRRARSGKRPN